MNWNWRRKAAVSLGIAIPLVALAAFLFGPVGFAASFAVGLIGLAWYNDNKLGTCLPMAVLFLIIAGLLGLLLMLMLVVVTHPG